MATITIRTLRRRAAEQGYSIWKVHSSTREYWEFGPYALISDDNNSIDLHGVGIDELVQFLDGRTELRETG